VKCREAWEKLWGLMPGRPKKTVKGEKLRGDLREKILEKKKRHGKYWGKKKKKAQCKSLKGVRKTKGKTYEKLNLESCGKGSLGPEGEGKGQVGGTKPKKKKLQRAKNNWRIGQSKGKFNDQMKSQSEKRPVQVKT